MRCHCLDQASRLACDSLEACQHCACGCPVVCEASQRTLALLVETVSGLQLRRPCVLRRNFARHFV